MLVERIAQDLKEAMKARDAERVSVLRYTLSEIKNARIEKGSDLDDADVVRVLRKAVKQREESAATYREGGREDLAGQEEREASVLGAYLPQPLSREDLAAEVDRAIEGTGAASLKDLGTVMKEVLSRHGDRVDGKEVQALVRERLGG